MIEEEDEDEDEGMESSELEVRVISGPAEAGGGSAPVDAAPRSSVTTRDVAEGTTSDAEAEEEEESSTTVDTYNVQEPDTRTDTSVVETNPKAATRALTPQSQYEMVQASSLVRGTVLAPPHFAAVMAATIIATQPSGADAFTCNVAIESCANFGFYNYCSFGNCRSIVPFRLEVQRCHRPRRW
jgi:hypothetical protein